MYNTIFAPNKKERSYGEVMIYGNWTTKWWQWAYSIPRDVNTNHL
jgi:hypothetical protein